MLTRFPDGIDGKSFYQKDAPEFAPEWMRTIPIWSEDTQREIRYFVCDDEESLLYIANMGSIPLHIWASRATDRWSCRDWCVIDLDPKEAPFSDVIRCAQVLHRVCESVGLPNYVKTTGKTGLHIMLPLGRQCTYEQSRMLGELLARVRAARARRHRDDHASRHQARRQGVPRLSAEPARPDDRRALQRASAAGSDRVNAAAVGRSGSTLDPRNFTIANAIQRLEQTAASDPVAPVFETRPDLAAHSRAARAGNEHLANGSQSARGEKLAASLPSRYVVREQIGKGGAAYVVLADDRERDHPVAVKILRPEIATLVGETRFRREIEILSHLDHPNILPLLDYGSVGEVILYFTMPFVEGITLQTRLKRETRLAVRDTIGIVDDVASALDYAHSRGIIHRDIKPANILLSNGRVIVADFGIARAMAVDSAEQITVSGVSLGTPEYMSPEQVEAMRRARRALRCVRFGLRDVRDARRRAALHRPHRAGDLRAPHQ